MPVTIEIEKRPLQNFQPSQYCEWCVTIKTDAPGGFTPPGPPIVPPPAIPVLKLEWALDFPADTDILDPKQAAKIKGAPKYKIDPAYGQGTTTAVGAKQVKICFVAACKERRNTQMSVENRNIFAVPPFLVDPDDLWTPVPHEGGDNGIGPIVGPAAVASIVPQNLEPFGFLASFEAAKLGALLGVAPPVTYQTSRAGQDLGNRRIRVSNIAEEEPEDLKPRKRARRVRK